MKLTAQELFERFLKNESDTGGIMPTPLNGFYKRYMFYVKDRSKEERLGFGEFLKAWAHAYPEAEMNLKIKLKDLMQVWDFLIIQRMKELREDNTERAQKLRKKLEQGISALESPESEVMKLLYGLESGQRKSHEEVSGLLDLEIEQVKTIETDCLSKLRRI